MSIGSGVRVAEQKLTGQQQAAGQPVGFFLLLGVACEERVPADLLQFAHLMAEQDVSQLMGDVALGARRLVAGVVDSHRAAVRQVEGSSGKRAGLQALQLSQAVHPDEFLSVDHLDAQMRGKLADVRRNV
ncbi:exonuclease [Streptomyces sp. KO7888]|nr:exonuclease [Streptomyces sp. KO7888]